MFGTIRKHQSWLWAVIITLTIISFVIFFSPNSKLNDGRRGANYGSINEEKVTEEKFANAQREVYLRYFFSYGRWPDEDAKRTGFDPMRETYQWLLLVQKEEQMGINVSIEVAAQTAREMIRGFERMGVNSSAMFFEQILKPRGFQDSDFERFLRHYIGIQELISTVGLGGKLVTPQEGKALYEREHQEMATAAVVFSASNYLANVKATPEGVSNYYTTHAATYRLPERVQVSYVHFPISNYLAQAESELGKTNLSEIVEANYQRLGTNYFRDAKSPEEAKAKIREELIRGRALAEARRQAADFARPLFETEPLRAENLEKVAKEKGLKAAVTEPFDREEGPKNLEVGADFTKNAFARTAEDPFAGPLSAQGGVYVIALMRRLPSEQPPLDQLRDRVTADYQHAQAVNAAIQEGMKFATTLTNALAAGKSFTNVCAEAKVQSVEIPPFSLSTRSLPGVDEQINVNQLKQLAFSTPPGKASHLQQTADGGFVLYVKQKLPIDQAKMSSELPNFISYVRRSRTDEAFNDWFRKQADRGLRDTPLAKPPQPPSMIRARRSPDPFF